MAVTRFSGPVSRSLIRATSTVQIAFKALDLTLPSALSSLLNELQVSHRAASLSAIASTSTFSCGWLNST
eukprot:4255523-Pyramimonas_sp.AAC.1